MLIDIPTHTVRRIVANLQHLQQIEGEELEALQNFEPGQDTIDPRAAAIGISQNIKLLVDTLLMVFPDPKTIPDYDDERLQRSLSE